MNRPLRDRLDDLTAELVACGCGDWDRVEASYDLHRYAALQRHWREVAPPAHVSLAALIGFKPQARSGQTVHDPDDLARQLRAMGVLG